MRKGRYNEEQIIRVLQEVESGRTVKEECREPIAGAYDLWSLEKKSIT